MDMTKVYKIKYCVNLLPTIGEYIRPADKELGIQKQLVNEDINLMGICNESEELEIYETQAIQQLIQFKWDTYAYNHHIIGVTFHGFHMLSLVVYINMTYILNYNRDPDFQKWFVIPIAVSLIYPTFYEFKQVLKDPTGYFEDIQNYFDVLYIIVSIVNIVVQFLNGPFIIACKLMMMFILLIGLYKTFMFLRIFSSLSPIVNMLKNVIYDLRIFLTFYAILIVLFSLLFGILGVGNPNIEGGYRDAWKVYQETDEQGYPGEEYKHIGIFIANIMVTLRMSMGDFSFDTATMLDTYENYIYWACWLLIVGVTCIIFLNFIIAEASASYEKVAESIEPTILSERAALICEADEMIPGSRKNEQDFPRYIIVREMEE